MQNRNTEWVHNAKQLTERRRELRKDSTFAEKILWEELRNNKLGVKFKRQNSIGGYIADFYCPKARLVIELDGGIHNTKEAKEYDEIRNKYFEDLGLKVLRFSNNEVLHNTEEVLNKVVSYL